MIETHTCLKEVESVRLGGSKLKLIDYRDSLLNQEVNHKAYGFGLISSVEDNYIYILFDSGVQKQFVFPSCFEMQHLVLIDSALSKLISTNTPVTDKFIEIDKYEKFRTDLIQAITNNRLAWSVYYEYIEDEDIYEKLKQDAIRVIKSSMKIRYGYSIEDRAIVTSFTSIVAFKFYDSGRFWEYLKIEFKNLYSTTNNQQKMEATIRELISNQEKLNDSRQITNPLVHAAVPLNYMKKFIDFTYDIFERNFDHSLDGVPTSEILSITLDWLSKKFISGDMEKDELSVNVTQKTYTLIKSTKLAIIHFKKDMIQFLELILGLINEWYYNDSISEIYPAPYKDILSEWIKDNQIIANQRKHASQQEYISRPVLRMNTDTKRVFLSMPVIPLNNVTDEDLYDLKVILKDTSEIFLVLNRDYRIIQRIGYSSIVFNKIQINAPLDSINIRVLVNDAAVYDSEFSLYRDIIVFDLEGKERINNRDYTGLVHVVYDKEIDYHEKTYKFEHYKVAVFMTDSTKVHQVGNKVLYFSKVMKPGLYGIINSDVLAIKGNQELIVYKSISNFVFESEYPKSQLYLSVNEQKFKLSNDICNVTRQGNYYNYNVDLHQLILNDDIKTIRIYNESSQEIKTESFILDSEIDLQIATIDDSSMLRKISINSSFNLRNKYIESADFTSETYFAFEFKLGFNNISYLVNPHIARYKWNDSNEWRYLSDIEHESNELIIASRVRRVEVLSSESLTIYPGLPLSIEGVITLVDVSYLTQIKNIHNYVILRISYIDEQVFEVRVFLNAFIVKYDIEYLQERNIVINFDIKCFRNKTLFFSLSQNGIELTNSLLEKTSVHIGKISEFTKYQISIFQKQNLFTGDIGKIVYNDTFTVYDNSLLAGHYFKVKEVTYWDKDIEAKAKIRSTAILFKRKLDENDVLILESSMDMKNECYECAFHKNTKDYGLLPFKSNQKIYAEIVTRKRNPLITIYLEYEDAEGVGFSSYKGFIEENYNENNTSIEYIIIDSREDFIK